MSAGGDEVIADLDHRRSDLLADVIIGGPGHRSACERFKHRLDLMVELRSVELAIEELKQEVWYRVHCGDCATETAFPQFTTDNDRITWLTDHMTQTGHSRIVKFEEPRNVRSHGTGKQL